MTGFLHKNMFKHLRLKKRELNLFILCCIIVVTVTGYVIIVEPFWKKYVFLDEKIRERQLEFLKLQRLLFSKDSIETAYEEISSAVSQLGSDEERLASFLKEVELSARSAGIYIMTLKPISVSQEGRYKKYLIRIEAEGKMETLAAFFYHLPDSTQLISAQHLQINYLTQEEGREEGLLQFKINLERIVVENEK